MNGSWVPSAALAVLLAGNAAIWGAKLAEPRLAAAAPETFKPLPEALGAWQGKEAPVDPKAFAILETEDVRVREYKRGEEPAVWLARVAGFGQRAAFHPPEICYVGSHFEVMERQPLRLMLDGREHRVMRLVLGRNKERVEAWYWFTVGSRTTPNYYQQQWWLMQALALGRPASGTLERLSTAREDAAAARARLEDFFRLYIAASGQPSAQP